MKILTIIGARPQFIKASVVSKALKNCSNLKEVVIHTGQHFDENMSAIFFNELGMDRPHYRLGINGGGHGEMTGRMLTEIEKICLEETPDRVLVYGDTNSTLAGALAAAKLHIPVSHIEAGLRSFNMKMPEEINRILTDQLSDSLFCPTTIAVKNLENEGFRNRPVKIFEVGDVMLDSALLFSKFSKPPRSCETLNKFVLATVHRAENTDDPVRLKEIVKGLQSINDHIAPVVLPLHPRTRAILHKLQIELNFKVIEPVGYLEMLWLLENCSLVVTDSGGLQKEAFFLSKYCITLRDQTEWVELVDLQVNELVGANAEIILSVAKKFFNQFSSSNTSIYGGGLASESIAKELINL